MPENAEIQGPDELEQRLRSMILHSSNANIAATQLTNSREGPNLPETPLKSTTKVGQKKFRGRKDYVKLDLNVPSVKSVNDHQEPSSQRQRGPRSYQQDPPVGYHGTAQAPFANPSRPHVYRPSNMQSSGGSSHSRRFNQPHVQYFAPVRRTTAEQSESQCIFLERVAREELATVEMSLEEIKEKERFRLHLQRACQSLLTEHFPDMVSSFALLAFGSISSGFGMPGCDMDLAFVPSYTKYDMPKALEKCLLDLGHGARLLTRTRVPILKICERPTPALYTALCEERHKFDTLSTAEEKENYMNPPSVERPSKGEVRKEVTEHSSGEKASKPKHDKQFLAAREDFKTQALPKTEEVENVLEHASTSKIEPLTKIVNTEPRKSRPWHREKRLGALDFPKEGVGIQCDINFSNFLGIHNSLLLRCYSHCDVRVKLMVLFVKKWAKQRKINSSYSGTLSSYGYVLMVLHFLVNICQPPVCPNLQLVSRHIQDPNGQQDSTSYCEGADVRFWRDEDEIKRLAAVGTLGQNTNPLGRLLRDFFHYYAQRGSDVPRGGFQWAFEVLSLRTEGGLLSKQEKGWTEAKTTLEFQREIKHRYLFAIEDPFELDHNVARTVTHFGIVAIRDEFRRAWRIISAVGRSQIPEGELFAPVVEQEPLSEANGEIQGFQSTSKHTQLVD